MTKHTFIFPGQGSQAIGMGKPLFDAFSEAKEVFQEVDEALHQDLSDLMFSGDEAELTLTHNTQPALMAVSVAVWRILAKQGNLDLTSTASFVAGHSLGEYTALTVADSLQLADCARLLRIRGNAMQQAVPLGQGGMAALIGVNVTTAENICEKARQDGECLQIANDNADGQVVISGHMPAIERAEAIAKEAGAKRYVILNVSAPFHSALMQPAADVMAQALDEVVINAPQIPLIANVTAQFEQEPEAIKQNLVTQMAGRVRWRESMQWAAEQGVTQAAELGSGKVLSSMMRRIDKRISATSLETPEQIEQFLEALTCAA